MEGCQNCVYWLVNYPTNAAPCVKHNKCTTINNWCSHWIYYEHGELIKLPGDPAFEYVDASLRIH